MLPFRRRTGGRRVRAVVGRDEGHYPRDVSSRARLHGLAAAAAAITLLIAYLLVDGDRRAAPSDAPRPIAPPVSESPRRHESPVPAPAATAEPPAAPNVAAPVDRRVHGKVTDTDGTPLPAADVALVDADDHEIARVATGADGAFEAPDSKLSAVSVVARAAAHQRRVVVLDRSGPGVAAAPVVVALEKAAAIVGRVRMADGSVPPRPVRVMVRRPLDLPPQRWSYRDCCDAALADDLRVRTATTDSSGAFKIDGLPPGLWCDLEAAGRGLGTGMRNGTVSHEAQAGGDPVEIIVSPLYAFEVRVRGPDGAELPRSRPFKSIPGYINWTGPYPLQTVYGHGHPALGWTGLPDADFHDPFHVLVARALDVDDARVGPYRVDVHVPGYAPVSVEMWAVPAVPGPIACQEIRLGPALTEFGSLRVRIDDGGTGFVAALAGNAAVDGSMRFAQLKLTPDPVRRTVESGVGLLSVSLLDAKDGVVEVEDVPAGDYVAKLELQAAARSVTDRTYDVRVDAHEVRDVVVNVFEWSGLRFDLDVGGEPKAPYLGTLEVTLQAPDAKWPTQWRLKRPPFVIAGVRPGTYDVTIKNPTFVAEPSFRVVLERDKVTTVARTVTPYTGRWSDLK